MAGPDPHDNTSADYEQFEKAQLLQGTAYSYVNQLVGAGVVDVTDDEQP